MQAHLSLPAGMPRRIRLLLEACWVVLVAKCLAVPWVVAHWQIPVHPAWVIVPTLVFGVLITVVALRSPRE
jgi:hypothetical protein